MYSMALLNEYSLSSEVMVKGLHVSIMELKAGSKSGNLFSI
jgi:hypothetical protein